MTKLETLRNLADLAEQLARLPDNAQVGAGTAALLISLDDPPSQRTMERWRQARNRSGETGPPFTAGPGRTSAVSYNVGAVRAWLRSRQMATTMEVAVRQGLAFGSWADASRPEPWVSHGGKIREHLLRASAEAVALALRGEGGHVIEVHGLSEAILDESWEKGSAREPYQAALRAIAVETERRVDALALAEELEIELPAPESAVEKCEGCGKPAHPGRPCRL